MEGKKKKGGGGRSLANIIKFRLSYYAVKTTAKEII